MRQADSRLLAREKVRQYVYARIGPVGQPIIEACIDRVVQDLAAQARPPSPAAVKVFGGVLWLGSAARGLLHTAN